METGILDVAKRVHLQRTGQAVDRSQGRNSEEVSVAKIENLMNSSERLGLKAVGGIKR
jgi:hypothetical protein